MKRSAIGFLVLILLGHSVYADPAHSPILPDPKMTPGDALTTDTQVVCQPGYAKSVRNVPQSLKNQVYRQYGVTSRQPHEYEVDHLVSLQLGGSNSIRNLWPQSFVTQPLNAYVKDRVENKLHELVCSGQLPLEQAQREIASNWVEAYKKYVGPVPEARPTATPSPVTTTTTPATSTEITPGAASTPEGSCPSAAPIKGSRSGIYHVPGSPQYDVTKARQCFPTTQAAEAAGYRAPKR